MENANEAIYIGIYTLIFVMALSLTIFLFSSLMSYTDEAYDYIHQQANDAVTVTGEVNRHLILTGQEVVSYYYNYVKTTGVNLKATSGVPRNYLEEIKSIYNNGVTIWHVDRHNVVVGDYSKDNYEV